MTFFDVFYVGIKAIFFYGLVTSIVKFDNLQKGWLFIALLYAVGVAFLSYMWFVMTGRWVMQSDPTPMALITAGRWRVLLDWLVYGNDWKRWALLTTVISLVYFRLITWFDEGVIFWTLLLLGMVVVWY